MTATSRAGYQRLEWSQAKLWNLVSGNIGPVVGPSQEHCLLAIGMRRCYPITEAGLQTMDRGKMRRH